MQTYPMEKTSKFKSNLIFRGNMSKAANADTQQVRVEGKELEIYQIFSAI